MPDPEHTEGNTAHDLGEGRLLPSSVRSSKRHLLSPQVVSLLDGFQRPVLRAAIREAMAHAERDLGADAGRREMALAIAKNLAAAAESLASLAKAVEARSDR